jgi:hypothetical protein
LRHKAATQPRRQTAIASEAKQPERNEVNPEELKVKSALRGIKNSGDDN